MNPVVFQEKKDINDEYAYVPIKTKDDKSFYLWTNEIDNSNINYNDHEKYIKVGLSDASLLDIIKNNKTNIFNQYCTENNMDNINEIKENKYVYIKFNFCDLNDISDTKIFKNILDDSANGKPNKLNCSYGQLKYILLNKKYKLVLALKFITINKKTGDMFLSIDCIKIVLSKESVNQYVSKSSVKNKLLDIINKK